MSSKDQPQDPAPSITITAYNPHGARLLRDLAARSRATDPTVADELERKARQFDAWRERNTRR